MNTQLPYAISGAVAAGSAFLVLGLTESLWAAAPVGVLALGAVAWGANRAWPESPSELEPVAAEQ